MKKSLRRKLIMSAVAVGAAAVGTTASTYAWFVSNNTVSTSEIQGDVVASNANLSIKNSTDSSYGLTATPILTGKTLSPLTLSNSKTGLVDVTNENQNTGYITFSLSFQATGIAHSSTLPLSITKVEVEDADKDDEYTAIADSQDTVKDSAGDKKITKGDRLKEDVTKALMLSYKADSTGSTAMTGADVTAENTFHLNTEAATYYGKQYYIDVMKTTNPSVASSLPTCPEISNGFDVDGTPSGTTKIADLSDTSSTVTIQFLIWLNGDDDACFDVIASHNWTLKLTFELGTNN